MTTDICTKLYEFSRSDPGRDIWMEMGGEPVLVVQSPATAQQVLTTDASGFDHAKEAISQVCGISRVTANGDDWKYLYHLSQPALSSVDVEDLAEKVKTHALMSVARLVPGSQVSARKTNQAILLEMTSSIMTEVFLNRSVKDFGPGFLDDIEEFGRFIGLNFKRTSSSTPSGNPDRKWLDGLGDLRLRWLERVASIKPTIQPQDKLLCRLSGMDAGKTTTGSFECELLMLFGAGSDTAAATVSWAALLLAEHPDKQQKIRKDLAQYWANGKLDTAGVVKNDMLGRFLNEVFRLYPAIPFLGRRAVECINVGENPVSKGGQVIVSSVGLGRNPDTFASPDALDLFRGTVAQRSHKGIFPFGAGPRRCGGNVLQ